MQNSRFSRSCTCGLWNVFSFLGLKRDFVVVIELAIFDVGYQVSSQSPGMQNGLGELGAGERQACFFE